MLRKTLAIAFLALGPWLVSIPAGATDDIVDRWYAALLAADAGSLSALLSDDARIRLDDLGIEQSKAEFLGSLEEWKAAAVGATIRHRIEHREGAVTTVLACYDFPSNDMLVRETFAIQDSRIIENTQAGVAEDCNAF